MAADNFHRCHAFTARHEGGYVDHPADPGGATNWGITRAVLAQWRGRPVSKAEVKSLSKSEAETIYKKNYWDTIGGETLPKGVDLAAYDLGVNSGVGRARQYLAATRTGLTEIQRAGKICDMRLAFVMRLRTWNVFGRGWGRRIAECKALAMRMAMEAQGYSPQTQSGTLRQEAESARTRASRKRRDAATASGGAVAAPTVPAAAGATDWGLWIFVAVALLALGAVAFLMWRAAQAQDDQVTAFEDAANEQV